MSRKRRRLPEGQFVADVSAIAEDGRAIATVDERAVRLTGAWLGETVSFEYRRRNRRYDEGVVVDVTVPSHERVAVRCDHFGVCGGCVMQHVAQDAQLRHKQARLMALLAGHGVSPARVLDPLVGEPWRYRYKARLGAKWLAPKQLALVGFRERGSGLVARLDRCEILHPEIGERIGRLRALLESLDLRERIPQIEVAAGDSEVALVLRHLEPLDGDDRERLSSFARETGFQIHLQSGGPDTVSPLWPPSPSPLSYRLPAEQLRFEFSPLDFTQVNLSVNRALVAQAMNLLHPGPDDRVLDLFCGLGNFTLPIAARAGRVVGLEGAESLAAKGRHNATLNDVRNVDFYGVDLTETQAAAYWLSQPWDRLLLDPPRSGALEVAERLPVGVLKSIVYVSCHPESLARDAAVLTGRGYRLAAVGVVDMFPHTNHVESIAQFEPA